MKPTPFPSNGRGLYVEHHKMREGGNYFVILYKNSARCISDKDPKDVWRVLGTAKYTETGKALKDWAVEIAEKNLPTPELDSSESPSEDPVTHTKMIT